MYETVVVIGIGELGGVFTRIWVLDRLSIVTNRNHLFIPAIRAVNQLIFC